MNSKKAGADMVLVLQQPRREQYLPIQKWDQSGPRPSKKG
jgi:hypothetical protein